MAAVPLAADESHLDARLRKQLLRLLEEFGTLQTPNIVQLCPSANDPANSRVYIDKYLFKKRFIFVW